MSDHEYVLTNLCFTHVESLLKTAVPHLRSLQVDPDLVSPPLQSTAELGLDNP